MVTNNMYGGMVVDLLAECIVILNRTTQAVRAARAANIIPISNSVLKV